MDMATLEKAKDLEEQIHIYQRQLRTIELFRQQNQRATDFRLSNTRTGDVMHLSIGRQVQAILT